MRSSLESLELTPGFVSEETWTLGWPGEHPSASQVRLLANGLIAGWSSQEDRTWTIRDGRLIFLDEADQCSVVFDQLTAGREGSLELLGTATPSAVERRPRLLRRTEPLGRLRADAPADVEVRVCPARRQRRNLVVLRADERSLHTQWARNIADEDRSWDFCISFFGNPDNAGQDPVAEYQVLQAANHKYHAIYDLFHASSPFWGYERFAFPDDDLMMSWKDINEMFAICSRYDLLLAQPAVTGYITHPIVRPNPSNILRFTSFVEPLAPWFSREALRLCAPTFPGTLSGYGLDHIWPKLLGEPQNRIAIVDKINFEHTRPIASSYSMKEALDEAWAYQMSYNAWPKEVEFGAILRDPVDRYLKW